MTRVSTLKRRSRNVVENVVPLTDVECGVAVSGCRMSERIQAARWNRAFASRRTPWLRRAVATRASSTRCSASLPSCSRWMRRCCGGARRDSPPRPDSMLAITASKSERKSAAPYGPPWCRASLGRAAGLLSEFGFAEAIAVASDLDDLGVMPEAVDEADGTGRVGEDRRLLETLQRSINFIGSKTTFE